MLRRFAYNKIFRTTGMLLLFILLLLFPSSRKYSLEDGITMQTSKELKKQEVFLIDKDGYVARTKISLNYNDSEDYAKKLIELLIIGGKYENKIPNGFRVLLPTDLKVNSVSIVGDSISIDLSNTFYEIDKKNEEKALELITYNLTSIDGIKKVYIKVDGQEFKTFKSSLKNVTQPFTKNGGVNKIYNVDNYKNTQSVTIYYINKNNNNYHYVPVTKITNDSREKIKIIIDELTSSHIYETNLMSFLNYNTKLLSYELKDNILTLNFNSYLFDDESSNNILEEVIYSISLSVRDNYDVKEVVFNVEGNEITKSVIKNIE